MPSSLTISTLNAHQHRQRTFATGRVLIGSSPQSSPRPAADFGGPVDTDTLSVNDAQLDAIQCSIEWETEAPESSVSITNLGRSIVLSTGPRLHRGQTVSVPLPINLRIAETQVQIFQHDAVHPLDSSLETLNPDCHAGAAIDSTASTDSKASLTELAPSAGTLSSWLESLGDLQRSVAGSREFFYQAARAVFNPGGLDGGMVLLPSGDHWTTAATYLPYPDYGVGFRDELIEQAVVQKKTLFHDASQIAQQDPVEDLHAAVISPVLDAAGEPIAVIYGFRSQHRTNSRRGIRALEAQFVQVIADSVSAAMTRLESEADAARSRAIIDQTFSPTVARHLENDPRFLDGKTTEVTVLFADLRGFSTISERVGPKVTHELLTDVMDCFSEKIADHDGVVIDFFGDGLSAFWNAPIEQPEHPLFACLCAITMLESMAELNERWAARLAQPLHAGFGLHTGMATVGNSGSRTRLKYGPQGNTVNIASRIEGTTRFAGSPIVASAATAERVSDTLATRRICKTQLDGIQCPVDLFQILPKCEAKELTEQFDIYQTALKAFEHGSFSETIMLLTDPQANLEADPISQFLLSQAITQQEGGTAAHAKLAPAKKAATVATLNRQTHEASQT